MKNSLLLLHGALGSKGQFEQLGTLLSQDFDVYDMTFAGHGGIPSNEAYSMQRFAAQAIAFMDENGIDQVKVFGYSMGGYVALQMALQFPRRISQIATLGTKMDWNEASAAKEVKMLNPEKIAEKVPAFADKLKQEHHPLDWQEVVRKTAKMMLDLGGRQALGEADFRQIQQPVCIGIGSEDKMVSYEESEYVSNLLPNGELHHLTDFPHPIEKINATALSNYIRQALS